MLKLCKVGSSACLEQALTIKALCSQETGRLCGMCVCAGLKRKIKALERKRELFCHVLDPLCVNLIASLLPSGRKYCGQSPPLISYLQTEAPTAKQHRQDEKWEEGRLSEYPGPATGTFNSVQIYAHLITACFYFCCFIYSFCMD